MGAENRNSIIRQRSRTLGGGRRAGHAGEPRVLCTRCRTPGADGPSSATVGELPYDDRRPELRGTDDYRLVIRQRVGRARSPAPSLGRSGRLIRSGK